MERCRECVVGRPRSSGGDPAECGTAVRRATAGVSGGHSGVARLLLAASAEFTSGLGAFAGAVFHSRDGMLAVCGAAAMADEGAAAPFVGAGGWWRFRRDGCTAAGWSRSRRWGTPFGRHSLRDARRGFRRRHSGSHLRRLNALRLLLSALPASGLLPKRRACCSLSRCPVSVLGVGIAGPGKVGADGAHLAA